MLHGSVMLLRWRWRGAKKFMAVFCFFFKEILHFFLEIFTCYKVLNYRCLRLKLAFTTSFGFEHIKDVLTWFIVIICIITELLYLKQKQVHSFLDFFQKLSTCHRFILSLVLHLKYNINFFVNLSLLSRKQSSESHILA